ncbi:MAG: multicopper oxidase [Caldilineaceae bacterium]
MFTRRTFLKLTAAGALGLYLAEKSANSPTLLAQSSGSTLDPLTVPKYQTPLLIPPVMPRAGLIQVGKGKNASYIDYYEISMKQFDQQILPSPLPKTKVWGYGSVKAAIPTGLLLHNAPSLTIEAKAGRPVRVKWINDLKDANGNYLPHLLPVDPTLHWANPAGGTTARDTRPTFAATPDRYTGPVPIVTHVHGSADVGDESDGYAEAWFLPNANNIPAGYAKEGTWYNYFKSKAASKGYKAPGKSSWEAGTAVFQYPNSHRASTMWYHDHALGMTRLNVYAGPAGFFIIRGGAEGDLALRDTRNNRLALLPGPAPTEWEQLFPSWMRKYREIPIAIQDRAFNSDGSLFYPDSRTFFDGISGPYLPETDLSPIWNPEFFGNTIMVNGNTWPSLDVDRVRYRFRMLNGCQSRFLILDFNQIPGIQVWQIGNEGGFLAAPVNLTASTGNRLLMCPAERADLIVDFSNVAAGNYVLGNVGPDEPFGGGVPGVDFVAANPGTTGQIMQFRVLAGKKLDFSTPPQYLRLPTINPLPAATVTRSVALLEEMSMFFPDTPAAAMLGTVSFDNSGNGTWSHQMWMDPITENPTVDSTEIWEIYNATVDAHPMHIHEVLFEVVDRQPIFVNEMDKTVQLVPGSTPLPPELWERGFKDTVIAYPGQVTRVRALFNTAGQYVWHCHIVEHEDNEMMRPYSVGPIQNPNLMVASADVQTEVEEELLTGEAFLEAEAGTQRRVFIPLVTNQ